MEIEIEVNGYGRIYFVVDNTRKIDNHGNGFGVGYVHDYQAGHIRYIKESQFYELHIPSGVEREISHDHYYAAANSDKELESMGDMEIHEIIMDNHPGGLYDDAAVTVNIIRGRDENYDFFQG